MNIPTDLLRTLLAVVDVRSFTQAAKMLGITQPAVSAQMKRLQGMLAGDLFDRRAPGIVLTRKGEAVVSHARRMIALNDQIIGLTQPAPQVQTIRVGLPGDLSGPLLPWTIAKFRKRWPDYNFQVRSGVAGPLIAELREGNVDIVVALSHDEPTDARHYWADDLIWARSDATTVDPNLPVPMLAFSGECMCYRAGVKALQDAGRTSRLVYTASTVLSLAAGVDAGLGVLVMTRSRIRMTQLTRWDDAPLPALPKLYVGIYVRDGVDSAALNELADELAPLLRPKPDDILLNRREYQAVSHAFDKAATLRSVPRSGEG
ncbi:MAG: LysR family transcriptional regulator [Pseudolabrys sp.]|nr:LysR family transcriptional regulator [Pseudolabrys sp.]